jgi:hypothetical protein
MTPGAQSERQWRPRGKEGGVNPTFITVEPISIEIRSLTSRLRPRLDVLRHGSEY